MNTTINDFSQLSHDYQQIALAIHFLDRNYQAQPGLKEIADYLGLSEYHFQRLFTNWVGISPKRFLQYLTKEHAKVLLENSESLLDTAFQTGLSGPSRLHDLFLATEAVTPGEYKLRGAGLTIWYGFHPSPFGECLIAATERGICYLAFIDQNDYASALEEVRLRWQQAELREDSQRTWPMIRNLINLYQGNPGEKLLLHLQGTNFQLKVWEALLRIPSGQLISYQGLAKAIGAPTSARAVGTAIGRNPIPVLIPCHRVIHMVGDFGNYRYGTTRKRAIIAWESARSLQEMAA